MAQFNIDIPGVGTVTVDGNFATEDSINRLASSIRRGGGGIGDPFSDFTDGLDDASDSLNLFDPAVRRNKKSVDDNTKSLNRFNDGFSRVDGMFSDLGDPGSGSLTKLVKSVGDAGAGLISGFTGLFGPLGNVIGGITTGIMGAFTGVITESIGFAQGLIQINKDINNAGLGMVNGLQDMESAAATAGVPFQQFSKALLENVDSIRLMTGGVQSGVGLISKSLKRLDRDGMQMLYSMGFTVEDIIGTMSDLAASASMVGQTLSDAELADATDKYLRNQQELARLTGVSVKEQREQAAQNRRSVFIQAQLQGLSVEQRKATEGFLNVLKNPGLQEFALKGYTTAADVQAVMSQLPTFGAALQEATQGVMTGAMTQEEATKFLAEKGKDPKVFEEMQRAQRMLGVTIEGTLGGVVGSATAFLGELQTSMLQQFRQSGADQAVDYQKRTLEGMNKSVAAMEQLMLDVNSAFSVLGFTLFSFVDGYLGKASDSASTVVDRFQEMSNSLKEYNLAREALKQAQEQGNTELLRDLQIKEREAKDKLTSLTGQAIGDAGAAISDIPGMIKSFVEKSLELFGQLKTIIADGIRQGFGQSLYDTGLGEQTLPAEQVKELAIKEMTKAIEEQNFEKVVRLLQENKQREQPFEEIVKQAETAGIKNTNPYEGNFLYDWGIITPPSFMKEGFFTNPWKKQALGGIFDYKPGGTKVTVAEASDEIVAPAKRGSDGRLGLEVSGAMLDNSRLLQSLVRINEGQAAMISSLSSQMANMNGNFEKLVYEQRQANRLAV